ncbi:type II secretion system pilot lipoprotein GspS-beta [Vibrio sp. V38_P2S17PM301]|uniref:GspS/AspS pilotin family protein n=2 Tax=Vibrio TaxID=662 RepID=UPI0013618B81|nr:MULTISPECIES: GspS/AspS pilotin family protein [unclassified Vibrio]NAX27990.1 type II secretion system pilot lipoprotein GspS-beta [Vibrio sp. V38_P2S17PM301]NAX28814.1 type II secretion system pilot lipoprotein GspS-beta [Vibrio sp. V37_P2S8PM304]
MKNYIVAALAGLVLMGCSSSSKEQRQLELIASNRANLIMAELPIERGPLTIMRASAKKTTIEIMMIYNQDAPGAKPIKQVLAHSMNSYCTNDSVAANLELGIDYRIKMRSSRGQLMVDQMVNRDTCNALNR